MLPAASGILPDNSAAWSVALLLGRTGTCASCTRAAGNMPAPASRMLALPCRMRVKFLLGPRPRRLRDPFENCFKRAPHHHRGHRHFGVTLVGWNEDAREECFQSRAAVA